LVAAVLVTAVAMPLAAADDVGSPRHSRVLDAAFRRLATRFLRSEVESGKLKIAASGDFDRMVTKTLEFLFSRYPGIRSVTAEESKRFEGGQFDDRANLERVDALAKLHLFLPRLSIFVVDNAHARTLSGADLEAGTRILEADVSVLLKAQGSKPGRS
jgi:hypothetical protein